MVAMVKSLTTEKIDGNSYLFKIEFKKNGQSVFNTVLTLGYFINCLPASNGLQSNVLIDDDKRFELRKYYSHSRKLWEHMVTMLGYDEELYSKRVKRAYLRTNGDSYTFLLYTNDGDEQNGGIDKESDEVVPEKKICSCGYPLVKTSSAYFCGNAKCTAFLD